MNCMKCGRELKEGQVFCETCLEVMELEPVKMNTPVVILPQPAEDPAFHHRPAMHLEEEVIRLRKANQNLIMMLAISVVAALLLGMLAYHNEIWGAVEDLGRNYSVVETQNIVGR